mgnify:CR=1 FL=1
MWQSHWLDSQPPVAKQYFMKCNTKYIKIQINHHIFLKYENKSSIFYATNSRKVTCFCKSSPLWKTGKTACKITDLITFWHVFWPKNTQIYIIFYHLSFYIFQLVWELYLCHERCNLVFEKIPKRRSCSYSYFKNIFFGEHF